MAIQRVTLAFDRTDAPENSEQSQRPNNASISQIELYRSVERPVPSHGAVRGESRVISHQWNLGPLELPMGAQLACGIEAADYRPGIGRTEVPRRIIIISRDELNTRLAEAQSQIVQRLKQALAGENATREQVRRIQIQLDDAAATPEGNRVALQAAELNQRQITQMLVDRDAGVAYLASQLLDEIEMNQVSAIPLRGAIEKLLAEVGRLSSGALSVAESSLIAVRKTAEELTTLANESRGNEAAPPTAANSHGLRGFLVRAGDSQDEVIARLQGLIDELAQDADVQQLAQQLSALRRDQIAHERIVREEIGRETMPLHLNELSRGQRTQLNEAADGQTAIAARLESILQAIDRLAQAKSPEEAAATEKAATALRLARQLAISANMREAARDLDVNRIGQALTRETQIADDLQQIVAALGDDGRGSDRIADQLREAEKRLAAVREQAAALREEIAQIEREVAATDRVQQLSQLTGAQQSLQQEIDQLARQLERLQAADAGRSARNAVERLKSQSDHDANQTTAQQPATSSTVQQAENDLEQAAQQLAEHRRQIENDLALELLRHVQDVLGTMINRQERVIQDTIELAAARKRMESPEATSGLAAKTIAGEERDLARIAGELGRGLAQLRTVQISLEETQLRLAAAAERLEAGDVGPAAQQAEQHVLARLEAMLQAFAQTASEASSQSAPAGTASNASTSQPPQRRPTLELLEVKILRMLQVDLNARTQAFRDRIAHANAPRQDSEQAEQALEASGLQAEQRRLAELVHELLTRDTDHGAK